MNKGNDNQKQDGGCPGYEFLSSYFDNEIDRASAEFAHIRSCPKCMAEIDAFTKIGGIMNRNISKECYPSLPEDILKKVRAKISEGKNTAIPFYLIQFMKVAAVIIVIVGVFAYIQGIGVKKIQVSGTGRTKTAPAASSISPAHSAIQSSKKIASQKYFIPENGIQFSNMRNVSTGQDTEFRNLPPDGDAPGADPVSIPDHVTHVWTVKNLNNASDEVNACIAKLGIPAGDIRISKEDDGMVRYSMNLSKNQIAGFVKLFASAGNELLSPLAPQPEQNLFYGNAADPVDYEIRLVQKGK
jgi:hypothetical protein